MWCINYADNRLSKNLFYPRTLHLLILKYCEFRMKVLQKYWVHLWNSLLEKVARSPISFTTPESQNLKCTCIFPLSCKNPQPEAIFKSPRTFYSLLNVHFIEARNPFLPHGREQGFSLQGSAPFVGSSRRARSEASPCCSRVCPYSPEQATAKAAECWPQLVGLPSPLPPSFFSLMFFSVLSLGTNGFI